MAYPTRPGHGAVGAYYHPPAPAHGRYPPPPAPLYGGGYPPAHAYGGYPTTPAYGSVYLPAPPYGGGYPPAHAYGGYPPAPAYGGYQNRPIIPGIVAAGIEALAIGVFRAAITNNLFGDGGGFNF